MRWADSVWSKGARIHEPKRRAPKLDPNRFVGPFCEPNVKIRTGCLVARAWVRRSTVQREALDQIAGAIKDIEPPALPFIQRRGGFPSQFLNGLKGMDESSAKIRYDNAVWVADHFMAIGEVEVIARWHEKLPSFLY
jgi:hypothetical protein